MLMGLIVRIVRLSNLCFIFDPVMHAGLRYPTLKFRILMVMARDMEI